jgi:hypothetical protein
MQKRARLSMTYIYERHYHIPPKVSIKSGPSHSDPFVLRIVVVWPGVAEIGTPELLVKLGGTFPNEPVVEGISVLGTRNIQLL